MFNKGVLENIGIISASYPLWDDGKNVDKTAGDGIFTSAESVFAGPDSVAGPRLIRVKVEVKDPTSKKRSAHSLDFGPFAIE